MYRLRDREMETFDRGFFQLKVLVGSYTFFLTEEVIIRGCNIVVIGTSQLLKSGECIKMHQMDSQGWDRGLP